MKEWHVYTGTPSWHQRRAGARASGVTVYTSKERAEAYVKACKDARPTEPAFIVEVERPK